MEYIKQNTKLPAFDPMPRFIWNISFEKNASTSRELYAFLLGKTSLSKKNGWEDDEGNVYIKCTVSNMAKQLNKSDQTIQTALKSLEKAGLIERRRAGCGRANLIFVKVKITLQSVDECSSKLDNDTQENLSINVKETLDTTSRKLDTNKTNYINTEKININKKKRLTL